MKTIDIKIKNEDEDEDTIDRIIVAEMFDQYNFYKQDIEEQKTHENLKDFQKKDLEYNERFLDAVKTMIKHYTIRSDWPKELKDEE